MLNSGFVSSVALSVKSVCSKLPSKKFSIELKNLSLTWPMGQVKDKFFSSIENFLDGSFEHTDFTLKATEETKPEFSIETFKPLSETDNGLTFFQGSIFAHVQILILEKKLAHCLFQIKA